MLAIAFGVGEEPIRWSLNDPKLEKGSLVLNREFVWIVATDEELAHIRKKVTGIPMTEDDVVVWFGDSARFIIMSLCS